VGATVKGAVHLNFPFRKPIEPTFVESDLHEVVDERQGDVFTRMLRSEFPPTLPHVRLLTDTIREARRGLIICGPRHVGDSFHRAIADIAEGNPFFPCLPIRCPACAFNRESNMSSADMTLS
jgi:2-succinyl-5-enolpyruvyl-6-hydroxy-3-cyclohexene-1-carboxylate synthase